LDDGFFNPQRLIHLSDGIPQTGVVKKEQYVYFQYYSQPTNNGRTTFTLTVSNFLSQNFNIMTYFSLLTYNFI
jgi:hypothetical protein